MTLIERYSVNWRLRASIKDTTNVMGRTFNFKKGVISFFDKFHNKRCFDLKKIIIINNLTLQVSKTNLVKFKETQIPISHMPKLSVFLCFVWELMLHRNVFILAIVKFYWQFKVKIFLDYVQHIINHFKNHPLEYKNLPTQLYYVTYFNILIF